MRIFILLVVMLSSSWACSQSSDSLNQVDGRNQKQGVWKKLYPNGVVRYRGHFADDKPIGDFKYFTEDGLLKTIISHQGDGIHSSTTIFDDQHRMQASGFYTNQLKDSLWLIFDASGKIVAEERYLAGKPHGRWVTFYASSSVPAQSQHWTHGTRDGLLREFFESGSLKFEQYFVDDQATGVVKAWYPDGSLTLSGNFLYGEKNGEWLYYTKEAKLRKKEVYESGKLISEEVLIKEEPENTAPLDAVEDPANQVTPDGY